MFTAPTSSPRSSRACEHLVDELVRDRQGHRLQAGSYVFDPDFTRAVIIKWEGDTDIVHGIEPCAHLSPALHAWATDERFLEPMQDFVGDAHPELFTEKLNLKRPEHGGVNPLHQDYPYWVGVRRRPRRGRDRDAVPRRLDARQRLPACRSRRATPTACGIGARTASAFLGNEIDAGAYPEPSPCRSSAQPARS